MQVEGAPARLLVGGSRMARWVLRALGHVGVTAWGVRDASGRRRTDAVALARVRGL